MCVESDLQKLTCRAAHLQKQAAHLQKLTNAENWSGSPAWQVVQVQEHVDTGPLLITSVEKVAPTD